MVQYLIFCLPEKFVILFLESLTYFNSKYISIVCERECEYVHVYLFSGNMSNFFLFDLVFVSYISLGNYSLNILLKINLFNLGLYIFILDIIFSVFLIIDFILLVLISKNLTISMAVFYFIMLF